MRTRGVITFVFDDGYERVYQNALPLLRRYKMPGVFALTLDAAGLAKAEGAPIRPWQEWLTVTAEGHEIASHGVHHRNLTTLTPAKLNQELKRSRDTLGATTFVYPGGAVDDRVVQAAANYYRAARSVRRGFETVPARQPMQLKSFNFTRHNFSVMKTNLLALWAYLTNAWLIETYHMVDDNDTQMVHTVKTGDLAKHLRFVAQLPVAVKTIRDVVEGNARLQMTYE